MIVALIREGFLVPSWKAVAGQQIDLEMDVSAIFGYALVSIGGMPHDGDRFARLDRLTWMKAVPYFAQVGVEGKDVQAFQVVAEDDVFAVIGEASFGVDIRDSAIGRGHDMVDWFTMAVALETFNVEAFVHLVAVAAHTAKPAGGGRFAHGADQEPLFSTRLEQGLIISRQPEHLGGGGTGRPGDGPKQQKTDVPHG